MTTLNTLCLIFAGSFNSRGYGQKRYEGTVRGAHRVAYVKANGLTMKDIEGLVIRHKCGNPKCVEPTHLETGTYKDNTQDCITCNRGHQSSVTRKLSDDAVRDIRASNETQKALAARYSLSQQCVSDVIHRRSYKELP